jgi:hypothetical protein
VRTNTDSARSANSARGTASDRRLNTAFAGTKISATPPQQLAAHDVTIAERLATSRTAHVKSVIYLLLFGLVSAIALIYKYLLRALIHVISRLRPAEFDRDAVINALNEVDKDSQLDD